MLIFVLLLLIILILTLFAFLLLLNNHVYVISFSLFFINFFSPLEIIFNNWRFLFIFMVLFIRTSVLFFSCSYIESYSVQNFLLLYVSFIVRMCWLILNNNFYWIIFGWDGLGVVSFLLIVFYFNQERVRNGLFTIFQNRLGDLFFVLFLVGLLHSRIISNLTILYVLVFLIFGARVKRAQFPFNAWLLAAIRAPTPISSLVHSSTLVVAGVYILLQFRYCLGDCLRYLKWIRLLTLFVRLVGLLNERDIKKLIAFSTINHVALIIFIIARGLFKITYFHLNIHAIFKSLIFICFGFVILNSYHRQDKRIVSLLYLNPLIKLAYNFSCLCLIGLPFLRGFFSKDFIIEKAIETNRGIRRIFFLIFFLGVRIYYSLKLLQLNFNIYRVVLINKNWLGLWRVLLIIFCIIIITNIYIALIFRLRLEMFSFKIYIYLFILGFVCLNVLTNLNFKLGSYDKIKNWIEIWAWDYYKCDQFVYWSFQNLLKFTVSLSSIKLILLMNWWVLIVFICLF